MTVADHLAQQRLSDAVMQAGTALNHWMATRACFWQNYRACRGPRAGR
jgi:hypothetical protein